MKYCNDCKQEKPLIEFSPKQKWYCRLCVRKRNRTYLEGIGSSERFIPIITVTEKQCAECKEMKLDEKFSPSERGRKGLSSYCKPCSSTRRMDRFSKEERALQTKAYRERNKYWWRFLHRLHQFNRRHLLKKTSDGSVTKEFLHQLFEVLHCYYCKEEVTQDKKTMEHKLPLHRGGNHSADNLVMACLSCNASKAAKTEEEYYNYLNKQNGNKC